MKQGADRPTGSRVLPSPAARSGVAPAAAPAAVTGPAPAYAAAIGASILMLLAIPLSFALTIWGEEAFAWHSTGGGIAYAWQQAIVFEGQPPLYFVIEAAWRTFNEASLAFARFPSAIFAAAAVAVIVFTVHRLAARIPPIVVALAAALNPLVIWAATEMRVYALVLLIGAVLAATFVEGYVAHPRSRRAQAVYIAFAVAGLYTQYYIGFVLLAHALTLALIRRQALRAFAAGMAVVAIAFAPFVPIAVGHVAGSDGFVRHVGSLAVVREVAINVFAYAVPHEFGWTGGYQAVGIIVSLLLVGLVAFGRPKIDDLNARATIVGFAVAVAIFIAVLSLTGISSVRRHLIVLAAPAIVTGWIFIASLTYRRKLIERITAAVFVLFLVKTLSAEFAPPFVKYGDWKRVAQTVAAGPVAPIAVFPAEVALTLGTYAPQTLLPIPRPMPFTYTYIYAMVLHGDGDVARVLDPVRARSRLLWLVTTDTCDPGAVHFFNYRCDYLEAYMRHHYEMLRTFGFYGSRATLYERRSG